MRCAAALGTGMAAMLPLQTAQAFGGAGNLGECSSFTTCTAGVSSSAFALARYHFDSIVGGYALPINLVPGFNTFQDTRGQETTAARPPPAWARPAPTLRRPGVSSMSIS